MKLLYLYWALGIILFVIVVMAILFVTSISRYAKYWQQQAERTDQAKPLSYVALGDSAAQGIGASSAAKGYVGLIAKRLSQQKNQPVHVINLSKSGAKISDVLNTQIPELNKLHPDVITIEIGANDIKGFDATRFEAQATSLFEQLPKDTFISDIPYFGGRSRWLDPKQEKNVVAANVILHRLAHEQGRTLVELHQETQKRNKYPWDYAIDYFHPNNIGYRAWADVFWDRIQGTL